MRKLALIRKLEPESEKAFWPLLARPDQLAPEGERWTTWLVLGGRGAGKTRAGAEWIRSLAEGPYHDNPHSARAIALVAESYADAREIMIEGPSGILALSHSADRPRWEPSRRRLLWERTGAVAHCFSAEDPEGLRGFQFDAAWSDELCKWRYPEETWSNLQLALRLGRRPRQAVTTTPRPIGLLKRLMAAETSVVARASTYANRENLAPAFFEEVIRAYEGTALGRQELLGELIEHVEGALWTWPMIEAARIAAAPELARVVVAVDPPASAGPDADECGIVVAGRADETAYVLADYSARGLSPRAVIAQVAPAAPVRAVRAVRGKRLRAEPVAALYEQGRVRHVGAFRALEDQMTSFAGEPGASPDRLDALVWAITDLMLRPRGPAPGVRRIE